MLQQKAVRSFRIHETFPSPFCQLKPPSEEFCKKWRRWSAKLAGQRNKWGWRDDRGGVDFFGRQILMEYNHPAKTRMCCWLLPQKNIMINCWLETPKFNPFQVQFLILSWLVVSNIFGFFSPRKLEKMNPFLTDISSNGLKPLVAEIIWSPPERMFWLTKNADHLAGDAFWGRMYWPRFLDLYFFCVLHPRNLT